MYKFLSINIFLIIILLFTFDCFYFQRNDTITKQKTHFILKVDSLKNTIPTVKKYNFDFRSFLPGNEFYWYKSPILIKIDQAFIDNYLMNNKVFMHWLDYQSLYYCCFIDCCLPAVSIVIMQRIHNNTESHMYLVNFDSLGQIVKIDVIASIQASPIDIYRIISELKNDCKIKMTKIYYLDDEETNEKYKDSVIVMYDVGSLGLTNGKLIDSVRIDITKH